MADLQKIFCLCDQVFLYEKMRKGRHIQGIKQLKSDGSEDLKFQSITKCFHHSTSAENNNHKEFDLIQQNSSK